MTDLELDSYEFNSCSKCTFTNGIEGLSNYQNMIYPNPASSEINISNLNYKELLITNLLGEEMFKNCNPNLSSINVSEWQSGIYILKHIDSNNKISISKFTVQH
jgi:hypothetical protein